MPSVPLAWADLQARWLSGGHNLNSISSCTLVIPLFFDINAKRISCSQWVTPFVFNQISSANLMGFINVSTDYSFVKDIVEGECCECIC